MGRDGLYFLSRRPDLDEARIGALAVEPCPSSGSPPGLLAVKRKDRRLLIRHARLAATDGQIVLEPGPALAVPELLDKGTIRTVLRGMAPAPDFILLGPGRRKTTRLVRLRGSSPAGCLKFVKMHGSAYVKPAGATGSGAFVIRLSSSGGFLVPESSDLRLGKLRPFPCRLIALERFLRLVRARMEEHGRTPYLIIESEIPALKLRGRNVDLRFLVQKRRGRMICVASYAKVGADSITANIGTGGRGRGIMPALISLTGSAAASLRLYRKMRSLSVRLVTKLFARLRTPPPLAAADFVLVRERGRFVPFLMEVNQGPVCFTGLKAADRRAYAMVLRAHEDNLAEAVSEYRRRMPSEPE